MTTLDPMQAEAIIDACRIIVEAQETPLFVTILSWMGAILLAPLVTLWFIDVIKEVIRSVRRYMAEQINKQG